MSERIRNSEFSKPEIPKQETELSPEVIEMVMEKVEDVNTPGTAFHVFNANRKNKKEILGDVLRDGILGITRERKDEERGFREKRPISHRGAYVEDTKKGEMPEVYFDIVDRMCDGRKYIKDAHYIRSVLGHVNLAIIFDLSEFSDALGTREGYDQELQKLKDQGSKNPAQDYTESKLRIGTFLPNGAWRHQWYRWNSKDPKKARSRSDGQDMGHVLIGRVSPRFFKGIVLKVNNRDEAKRLGTPAEERDPNIIQQEVKKIVDSQLKVYKLNPDKILPIYDMRGNLLWPKQMSHQEITKEEEK